jgi:hypothetical protein
MRALLVALCATTALMTACTGGSGSPSARPSPSAPVDPYVALAPPTSPGVGSFDAVIAQRAYDAAHGLLALSLAEPATLTGAGTAALLDDVAVPNPVLSVVHLLRPPTRRGLDIRPLFARTVTLAAHPVEIVRSSYSADEVQGPAGEQGIRISWDGAVRYRVLVAGAPHQVAYALQVAYVFEALSNEPGGLRLVQVVPGRSHATPVVTSCLAKGVLLPGTGTPTSSDFGPGPWLPDVAGPACPV